MESKNLIIKKTCFGDYEYFAVWETQKFITEFLSINENKSYEETVRESIIWEQDPTKLQYTIYEKELGKPIGRIYLSRVDPSTDSLDITRLYIGNDEKRGKGYGEEALRLILEYCFMNLHMERVSIDHHTGNKIASNLFLKLGFQYEGITRNARKRNGKYHDLNLMSILRAEYFERVHSKRY